MVTYRQSCKWSRFTWIMTLLVIGFIGLLGCLNSPRSCDEWMHFTVRTLLLVLVLCAVYYCPLFMEVNHHYFYIVRLLRKKAIPLEEIAVAIPFDLKNKRPVRICGAGGFFGFWGWYYASGIGRLFLYATRLDNLLLIQLQSGRKYVVSCEDPAKMARFIQHYQYRARQIQQQQEAEATKKEAPTQ